MRLNPSFFKPLLSIALAGSAVFSNAAFALQGGTPATMPGARMLPPTLSISSPFGWRVDPINGQQRFHAGIDLPASTGTPVLAGQGGYVIFSGVYGDYGQAVVINHGQSLFTLYGHNSERLVNPGQYVQVGQPIARVGATGRVTGPHLHFEVHYNKQYLNPADYIGSYFRLPLGPMDMLPPVIASKAPSVMVAQQAGAPAPKARVSSSKTTMASPQGEASLLAEKPQERGFFYSLLHRRPRPVQHVNPNEKTIPLSWNNEGPSSVIGWKDTSSTPPTPGRSRVEMVTGNRMETVEF
jgi:hypothetical protein